MTVNEVVGWDKKNLIPDKKKPIDITINAKILDSTTIILNGSAVQIFVTNLIGSEGGAVLLSNASRGSVWEVKDDDGNRAPDNTGDNDSDNTSLEVE